MSVMKVLRIPSLMAAYVLMGVIICGCVTAPKSGGEKYLSDWPLEVSPALIGKRVAENFLNRKLEFEVNPRRQYVIYPEVCAWYGALRVAKLTGDTNLRAQLIKKFDYLLTPEGRKRISNNAHVDYRVFGIVPLEIYMQTGDKRYLELGRELADKQWEKTTPDGITIEARYWIDDMYMITALQVQAYRATKDRLYLDRAAKTMVAYLDRLQQPNGLFYHAEDSPWFWCRGNGWVAAGLTELLKSMPEDHPLYPRVMQGYKKMMGALLKYQDPNSGIWRQLIDREEFWPETSGSAMFTFAMVTGIKRGWLPAEQYGPAVRKAWLSLVTYLDDDANLREVCVGTGKAYERVGADKEAQLRYYMERPRQTGDLHGQAPMLWTACALLE